MSVSVAVCVGPRVPTIRSGSQESVFHLLSFDRMTLVFVILFQTGLILSVSRYLGFKSFSICCFVFCSFLFGCIFYLFSVDNCGFLFCLFFFAINTC